MARGLLSVAETSNGWHASCCARSPGGGATGTEGDMPAGASATRGRKYDTLEAHKNHKGAVQKIHQTRQAH